MWAELATSVTRQGRACAVTGGGHSRTRGMKLSGLRRLWIGVAILPLIGGVALASGPAMFVCRGDSVPRKTCCCPASEDAPAPSPAGPSLSAACCCDLTKSSASVAPAVEPRVSPQAIEPFMLAPIGAAAGATPRPTDRAWAAFNFAHAPPQAIAILLRKQSFLL